MRLTGNGEARRGVGGETSWFGANLGYAPAGEILIEAYGVKKHDVHIRNAADIPAADILIEGSGIIKHASHIRNTTDIPVADILIEGVGAIKHVGHIRNAVDIPTAYIPIEAILTMKQVAHIGNAAGAASSDEAIVCLDLGSRPFGIFSTIYCAGIAICGIGTANSYAIAIKKKGGSA